MTDFPPHPEQDLSADVPARQDRALSDGPAGTSIRLTPSANGPADIDFMDPSFELVRCFVKHLAHGSESDALPSGLCSPPRFEWEDLRTAIAGSHSIEHAIGRAVVIADRMSRGASGDPDPRETQSGTEPKDHPFFGFSVADAVPDFGDRSRYRTRAARRLTEVFGSGDRS
jgi:hypothetical protein